MARSRPHFKVHTTALHHPKMSEVIADNELFGLWVKLGVLAIERYASKNDDEFNVSHSELLGLTNRKRVDKALFLVSKLVDSSTLTMSSSGRSVVIGFPNLSKKQGFHPKKVQESPPPIHRHIHNPIEDNSIGVGSTLTDERVAAMIAVRPGGALYSEREVRAWAEWIAPQIRLRGHSDIDRKTLAWWTRARPEAVEKAVEWAASVRLSKMETTEGNSSETDGNVPDGIWSDH